MSTHKGTCPVSRAIYRGLQPGGVYVCTCTAEDREKMKAEPRIINVTNGYERPTANVHFKHGPLDTLAECDEWIASTFRKLPDGALAKLYRLLHDGHNMTLDNARMKEAAWLKSLKS